MIKKNNGLKNRKVRKDQKEASEGRKGRTKMNSNYKKITNIANKKDNK